MQISLFNILIAFAGGLLSFLSPCVLPLVPGYISLMSGVSIDHLKGDGGSRSAVAQIPVVPGRLGRSARDLASLRSRDDPDSARVDVVR